MAGFTPRFPARVDKHGIPHLLDKAGWDTWMANHAGRKVEIVARPWRNKRSPAQNRAYWKLVAGALSEHTGYEKEEVHALLKERFGVDTTQKMDTEEFEEYQARVRRWAAQELDIDLPEPHEVAL